jgi:hypothetical protein
VQRTLLFRLDACPGSPLIEGSKWLERSVEAACVHEASVQQFRKKIARRFKLKLRGAWMSATLGAAQRPFFDHVKELSRLGMARLGDGHLTERLTYSDQFEWYRLEPQLEFSDRNRKVAAAQLLDKTWQTRASNLFRNEAEGENLRGLIFGPPSFKPIKGDPRWWFGLHPGTLAGRGLDQEWAPPYEPLLENGDGRLGADSARNDTARVDRLDPAVAELCSQFPPGRLSLKSFPRLWAGSLPDADFAGLAWIPGGNECRVRSIIIRRSAVNVLLKAGMLETEMLGPIDVVKNRGDARVPILDEEIGPLPASVFIAIAAHNSHLIIDEPETAPSEPSGVPPTHAASTPGSEVERVSADDIQAAASALGIAVPRIWQQFLSEIGRSYLGDMYPSHPSSWVEDQPDHEDLKAMDDTLPSRMLSVGGTLSGDWYSLDLDTVSSDGDCRLLKFDHETSQCVDCWPSLAAFISELIDAQIEE